MISTNNAHLTCSVMVGICLTLTNHARPLDIRSPNLDPVRGAEQPLPVLVPEGGNQLLSRNCAVSSSVAPCRGELTFITDGDKECEKSESNMVRLAQGIQWVQIDLGTSKVVNAVCLWHHHAVPKACRDVVIQLSDDEHFVQDFVTVFNNDHDNSAGLGVGGDKEYIDRFSGKIIPVASVRARYVRVYGNGCYMDRGEIDSYNYYSEIEVYGGNPVSSKRVPLMIELPRPQFW